MKFFIMFRFQGNYSSDGKECSRMTKMIKFMKQLLCREQQTRLGLSPRENKNVGKYATGLKIRDYNTLKLSRERLHFS